MKKSFLLIFLSIVLCCSTTLAEEPSTKVSVDPNAADYESWVLSSTTASSTTVASSTQSSTSTSTTTETNSATDTKTTNDNSSTASTNTDTSTNTAISATNPFNPNLKVTKSVSTTLSQIADVDVAKACGIENISDGYPKDGTVTGVGDDVLRLRSWPWGNIIGKYSNGTSVKVLGESGEFYLVEVNGTQGYMHKNYVSTADKAGSGQAPYYPGNTRSGGSLSLSEGVKASKDGAEGKVPTTETTTTPGAVNISGDKVVLDVPKNYQGTVNTPAPWSSCGPTSLSMILGFYGKGDPTVTVTDIYNVSGCTKANGTGHDGLAKAAKKYGMSNAQWHYSVNQNFCREQLKAGKPLLCHVKGHYVVMKGMDANGNVILNDPAWKGVERTMSWSDFVAWWKQSNSPMSCMTC